MRELGLDQLAGSEKVLLDTVEKKRKCLWFGTRWVDDKQVVVFDKETLMVALAKETVKKVLKCF